jgi:glycerophosphoryl diester phosphodiesterase
LKIFVSIFIIILLSNSLRVFSQENNRDQKNDTLPEKGICAHRGAMESHPENTLAAFKEAIRLGAHMIEFDVQMTKDSQLVIIHDASLDRTTNGAGLVSELTLKEIKTFDAGSWKSQKYIGERIPTLKETLEIMPKNIWLNIHLKGGEELGIATAKILVLEERIQQGVIACGYDAARGVKKVSTNILICNMERLESRKEYINQTIKKGHHFIQLKNTRDDDGLITAIKKLKQHQIMVNYYHTESADDLKELFENGIDFILTNHLSKMLNITKEFLPAHK